MAIMEDSIDGLGLLGAQRRGRYMVKEDGLPTGMEMSGRTNDPRGYFFAAAGARPRPVGPTAEQIGGLMGNGQNGRNGVPSGMGNGGRPAGPDMNTIMQFMNVGGRGTDPEEARLMRIVENEGNSVSRRKTAEAGLARRDRQVGQDMQSRDQGRAGFAAILQSLYGAEALATKAEMDNDTRRFTATEGVRKSEVAGEKKIEQETVKQTAMTDRELRVTELAKNKDYERAGMVAREGLNPVMIKATNDYAIAMLNNSTDERIAKINAAAKAKADPFVVMSLSKDPAALAEYLQGLQANEAAAPAAGTPAESSAAPAAKAKKDYT